LKIDGILDALSCFDFFCNTVLSVLKHLSHQFQTIKYFQNKKADRSGRTPLHWASIGGGTSSASLLIENGANVLAETGSKATPLHFSVEKGNIDMVPLLANNAGNKKLELFRAQRDDGKTALNIAKEGKNKGIIKALKEAGDPSATSSAICIIS